MAPNTLPTELEGFLASVAPLAGSPDTEVALADLKALAERAVSKPQDLTYVLLFGPTGCGKSKLTNTIFGRAVTPVGFRRPTTSKPHVVVPAGRSQEVLDSLPLLPFELVELEGDSFARLVLIDTPDIDSLCAENQTLAEAFLRFADAVLVVLDPVKYGDDSIWHYLRRFHKDGLEFRIVCNKVKDAVIVDDLKEKLRRNAVNVSVLTIPFQPTEDHELLTEGEGVVAVRTELTAWAASEELRRTALMRGAGRCVGHLSETLVPWIEERREKLLRLQVDIATLVDEQEEALRRGLPFQLDKQTLASMYQRLLEKLDRIDPLRLPRRILSYPFRLLREKFGSGSSEPAEAEELKELWDLKEEAFVNHAMDLAESVESISTAGGLQLPDGGAEAALREAYHRFQRDFQQWLKEQAEELAGTLTVGQRVRFYVAQGLVFGALIGVEAQTGGILTITEVLTGGMVSPFAAKLIGMALSAEESRRFQEKARQRYLADAVELMRDHIKPAVDVLEASLRDIDTAYSRATALLRTLETVQGERA